jgi:hypothetical protein
MELTMVKSEPMKFTGDSTSSMTHNGLKHFSHKNPVDE